MIARVRDRIRGIAILVSLGVVMAAGGCGKKGPPLAPLRLVPTAVTELTARQISDDVRLQFVLPTTNLNGPGRIDLDRVEIYAMTIAPGSAQPANRDLLNRAHVVGTISVRPPPPPGERPEETEPDDRPGPGDRVSFVEALSAEKLKPEAVATPPAKPAPSQGTTGTAGPVPGAAAQPGGASGSAPTSAGAGEATTTGPVVTTGQPTVPLPTGEPPPPKQPGAATPEPVAAPPPAPAAPPTPAVPYPVRVYAVRGISKGGRPGQPSPRVQIPIVPVPTPPTNVGVAFTERAITVNWTPPVAAPGGPPLTFNVYQQDPEAAPLNPSPITTATFEHPLTEFGKEQCFVVRTVQSVLNVTFESEPSAPKCVTPRDTFAPATPKGLNAVSPPGAIQLTWDANAESDLAGYKVLRADAPGDTLRPLTPEPIKDASFTDSNVKPGTVYVYAIVAVDRVGNESAQSSPLQVTAR